MERETFDCEEYVQSSEIQYFPAERYFVKETVNCARESYSAPETSLSQNTSTKINEEGMTVDDAQELMQSTSTSTASSSSTSTSATSSSTASASSSTASASVSASASAAASATASVGATSVLAASVATICVATIVGSVSVPGLTFESTNDTPPVTPIEEVVDYGTFKYDNYVVEYTTNEDSDIVYANITFNFEGELLEDFSCRLTDNETGESTEVNAPSVEFSNIVNKDRTFDLSIYSGDEVVESQTINFEDHYLCGQNNDSHYVYKSTFNDDNTYNLYTRFIATHEGEFVTYINVSTLSDDFVDSNLYETAISGDVSYILNINSEKFSATFVSYYVKDGNYYYYYSSEKILIGEDTIKWNASVLDKKLTLSFDSKLDGVVEVIVTHDDTSVEEFTFNADEIVDNTYEITLSSLSQHPTVEVYASAAIYDFDPTGDIADVIGSEYIYVYDSVVIDAVLTSTISLAKFEIFNTTYNGLFKGVDDALCAPVNLYFDGYLNEGDNYSVKVFNLDGEVTSVTGITSLDKPITLTDLLVDMEYYFVFYLTANGEETQVGETTNTLSMIEILDLPPYYCNTPNPGDVLVTYNDDGTSNVYMYMNVQETTYDMYYKAYLVDVVDNSIYYECSGSDMVAVFSNIPSGQYSIRVGAMLNDNGTCYSMYDMQWPSGSIYVGLDQDGYYYGESGSANFDIGTGELSISVSGKVMGDLRLLLTPTGEQPISITIPPEDINTGNYWAECTVDLSAYSLIDFTLVIIGEAIFQYGNGDTIKNEIAVTGNDYCPFKIEITNEIIIGE